MGHTAANGAANRAANRAGYAATNAATKDSTGAGGRRDDAVDLFGAVAVVLGAGTPAGRAVCIALAADDALVYCADLLSSAAATTAAAIVAGGGRASERSVDVTEREEVDALLDQIVAAHGRLDLVCNVATARSSVPVLDLSAGSVERTVVAGIRGAFFSCQAAARVMTARGTGTIVNVVGPSVGGGAVASAAIVAITEELGRELSPHGVRVAAVGTADPGTAVGKLAAAGLSRQAPAQEATAPLR